MSYLLDTNLLSETRKRQANRGVMEWLAATPDERMYVSVVTIGEIERGVTQLADRGDHRQSTLFAGWLEDVLEAFAGRIVPITAEIARAWGRAAAGRTIPTADGLIAATASTHGWTVVTRNIKDFQAAGARPLNPFTP